MHIYIKNTAIIISFIFALFFTTVNASDLDLNYNPISDVQLQGNNYQNHQYGSSDSLRNMGADGRRNMQEADARNRRQAEQKGKGSGQGKGNGQGNGQGKGQGQGNGQGKGRGRHNQEM